MLAAGPTELLLLLLLLGVPIGLFATFALRRSRTSTPSAGPSRTSVVDWLVTLTASAGACVIALTAGMALGLFGLALVALIISVALLSFAVLVWKRGTLPLALVAASLAAGATLASAASPRIDRSAGMLVVAPRTGSAVDDKRFVRGLGSVLVDLRATTLAPGSTTRITARSDTGRVVVALPNDRCVNLRVHARRQWRDTSEAARLATSVARRNGVLPEGETDTDQFGAFDRPDRRNRLVGTMYPTMPVMIAYGRTVVAGRSGVARWKRTTKTGAPTIELDLSAGSIVVRDYPQEALGTALAGDIVSDPAGAPWTYPELRGADWPRAVDPTVDRPKQEALRLAKLAAGACATRSALAASWASVPPPPLGLGSQEDANTQKAVNGLGQYLEAGDNFSAITNEGRVKP